MLGSSSRNNALANANNAGQRSTFTWHLQSKALIVNNRYILWTRSAAMLG